MTVTSYCILFCLEKEAYGLTIYLFTTKKRGVSSCQMAKWLSVRQKTAWFMLHRLREALRDENGIVLRGIVEADETTVGPNISRDTRLQAKKRIHDAEQEAIHGMSYSKIRRRREPPGKRGRKKGETLEVIEHRRMSRQGKGERIPFERKTILLGMTEKRGRVVMKKLGRNSKSITKDNIYPHLSRHITSNSILITDELSLYNNTSGIFAGHQTVNHNIAYCIGGIHINNIENSWLHLKKVIAGTYFHLSYGHFDRYLNENTFRWNRRTEPERLLFDFFLPLVEGKTLQYKKLVQKDVREAA